MPRHQNRTFNVYAIRCILEFSINLKGYFPLIRNVVQVMAHRKQCSNSHGPEGVQCDYLVEGSHDKMRSC